MAAKVFKTIDEQISILKSKGLVINDYDKASEICKERASLWKYFPLNWLAAAIDYYGFELVENFINFCDENNIRDWHSANYGWREDGSPVVIDWGGYLDD